MIKTDEEALICDLAETYNVFNYRELPVFLLATLSVGLRANSRIKMIMNGQACSNDIWLLSTVADRLAIISYQLQNCKGDKPVLLTQMLARVNKDQQMCSFDSGEAFLKAREKILEGCD